MTTTHPRPWLGSLRRANQLKPAIVDQWRYASGYNLTVINTGLLLTKFGTRYYDPAVGRWTQLDPSGVDKHYVYVANNPVNHVDPSGNIPCAVTAPVNAFIGGAKVGSGIAAAVAGTVAIPFTGGLSGPPAYAYAAYQAGSGSARIARGVRQGDDSGDCGFVDLAKRILPDPSSVVDFLGGL